MKKTSLAIALFVVAHGAGAQFNRAWLQNVLNTVNQVQSASYTARHTVSAPGDTLDFKTLHRYEKEFVNPSDKTIGSTFAWSSVTDPEQTDYFYDGKARGHFNWDKKVVSVDSFRNNRLSFRPVGPPFFNYVKSILKYSLETTDNILLRVMDLGDSVRVSLTIHDEVVEFFGNDICYTDPADVAYMGAEIRSQYDIWIRKSDNLPYRLTRNMPHNKSSSAITGVSINRESIDQFSVAALIPKDFSIVPARTIAARSSKSIQELVGKNAPDWLLTDVSGNTISLKDLKSKVILIQFTGIGCGPCHQSIHFLKQLVEEYKTSDFEFVSIETWSKNHEGLKRYYERNALNYKFLKSEEGVADRYNIYSVPAFFILDEKRVIRKVLMGYGKGETDKAIRDAVREWL